MSADPQIHRDLGSLTARLNTLESSFERRMTAVETKVGEVHDVITTAKGGWKTLVVIGSIGAGLGALATKLLGLFATRGGA